MKFQRRQILKAISLGTLIPAPLVNLALRKANSSAGKESVDSLENQRIDQVYKNAIVFDGLLIPRGWDDASFEALGQSGYTGFNASLPSRNFEVAMKAMEEWTIRINKNKDRLLHATTAGELVKAKEQGKAAVFYGFQNTTMIENSLDNIDKLYASGARWIQLTYNERNLIGDGCTERTNAGLSDFGIAVVERMNELGIIVDLSHCGDQTTLDGIRFSSSGASINHSMCEALYPGHPRAKSDKQIKAMAQKGGVLGIICLGYMIGPNPGGETTLETYVDHIDHAVNIAGIEHVGLSSDFPIQGLKANGATRDNWYIPRLTRFKPSYQVKWPPWIPELEEPMRYLHVAKALDRRGYKAADIEKILGGNWMRYYKEVLGA